MGLQIVVAQGDWGDAQPDDIAAVLKDASSHLTRLFREPLTGIVRVNPAPDTDPHIAYRVFSHDPFVIRLAARNRHWAQFAFQFSHEFCHFLSDYERLGESQNGWFHEAICELASVFTLLRMAETWRTQPPYPHWADYAGSLASYAADRLSREEHQLPPGTVLSPWLASEEESLRNDRYQREKNAIVASALLPIFKDDPSGWNAVRRLPASPSMFRDYLREWHTQAEAVDKPFVNRIIQLFEE